MCCIKTHDKSNKGKSEGFLIFCNVSSVLIFMPSNYYFKLENHKATYELVYGTKRLKNVPVPVLKGKAIT